jgi:glycosyltransferase involved in cell wall biosynthesis
MRILSINKFFFKYGGTEQYYFDLNRLLREHGHEVVPFSMQHKQNDDTPYERFFVSNIDFKNVSTLKEKIKAVSRIVYSREAKRKIEALIKSHRPDIAHLHNFAHQLTPSILSALKSNAIPIFHTMHDYKLICPVYTMCRNGEVCEQCLPRKFYHAVLNRCKDRSIGASLVLALEMYMADLLKLRERIDVFLAPSRFLQRKMIEGGIPAERVIYQPYFIYADHFVPHYEHEGYFLFMGQIIPVKGLSTLLAALRHIPAARLIVAGRGSESDRMKALAARDKLKVSFVGFKSGEKLLQLIRGAMAVVVPSVWYENQPYAVTESFASGKPVVGSRIGGIEELIEDGVDGLLFDPKNPLDLADKLRWIHRHPARVRDMGHAARKKIEHVFDPTRHYDDLMKIYRRIYSPN